MTKKITRIVPYIQFVFFCLFEILPKYFKCPNLQLKKIDQMPAICKQLGTQDHDSPKQCIIYTVTGSLVFCFTIYLMYLCIFIIMQKIARTIKYEYTILLIHGRQGPVVPTKLLIKITEKMAIKAYKQ